MAAAPSRHDGAGETVTALGLAWRTARRYRARAVLAIIGVAVIGALNFDMLLLSRGLLLSFAGLINSAGYNIRIVGSAGLSLARLPVEDAGKLLEQIRGLPQVASVAMLRSEPATTAQPSGPPTGLELIGTTDVDGDGIWNSIEGTGLAGLKTGTAGPARGSSQDDSMMPPAVISKSLASRLGLKADSTIRLRVRLADRMSALPAMTFRVVGVADFPFEAHDAYMVATTMDGFRAVHGGVLGDQADMILASAASPIPPEAAVAAISALRPDLRVFSNDQVIETFNRNNFAYFRQMSIVLSSTTAVFSFLLVATLLTVSVNQRLGEVAALRALGIRRRRIAATLVWEAALLVGLGGVLALPAGQLLAEVLDRILRRMPNLPEGLHFFVFEPRALVLHGSLLVATAAVAALYPVWLVATLPIAQTLRQEVVS
jgi:ABC-type lipoprotein release transport system permease subunit